MATRWGICSAGLISHDFTAALRTMPTSQHQIIAVAERQLDKAQKFADLFDIPKAYGTFQELADDLAVDVVYIGAIHIIHFDLCQMMLNGGKHVLCEKPMMMNSRQVQQILSLAKNRKKFFMEGFWTRFFPASVQLMKEIENKSIGEVKLVQVTFCAMYRDIERLNRKNLGGGVTLDLVIYGVQFACMLFNNEMPDKITAAGHLKEDGMDFCAGITLLYSKGRMVQIISHQESSLYSRGLVLGTQGQLEVLHPFWCPSELVTPTRTYKFPVPDVGMEMKYYRAGGFTYEIEHVRDCLQKGMLQSPVASHLDSTVVITILDAVRRQLGVVYEADEDTE